MNDNSKNARSRSAAAQNQIGNESLPLTTYWKDVRRRFLKNRIAVVGLAVLLVIIVLCVGAPCFTRYDPMMDMDLTNTLVRPFSEGHIFGTDDLGRDIWSRLLYGGRMSAMTGMSVTLLSAAFGIVVGLVSGYYPVSYHRHRYYGGSGIKPGQRDFGVGDRRVAKVCPSYSRAGAGD